MVNERVKSLRLALLLTTREFAQELGVTQATISSWETGKSNVSLKNQRKLKELAEKNGMEW